MHARSVAFFLPLAACLVFDRVVKTSNYQRFMGLAILAPIVVESFPLLWLRMQMGAMDDMVPADFTQQPGLNTSSAPSWSHDHLKLARACYWHATVIDVRPTRLERTHARTALRI
jgi:hypothetical protein